MYNSIVTDLDYRSLSNLCGNGAQQVRVTSIQDGHDTVEKEKGNYVSDVPHSRIHYRIVHCEH